MATSAIIWTNRSAGIVNLGVQFHGINSEFNVGTWRDAEYFWDFGDPNSGEDNYGYDPMGAHLYLTTGTFSAVLHLACSDGTQSSALQLVTVSAWPASTTYYYVAASGSDSNDGRTKATSYLTFNRPFSNLAATPSATQILIKDGDIVDCSANVGLVVRSVGLTPEHPTRIATWDGGKAVVRSTTGTFEPIIGGHQHESTNFTDEVRVENLNFSGTNGYDTGILSSAPSVIWAGNLRNFLMYNVSALKHSTFIGSLGGPGNLAQTRNFMCFSSTAHKNSNTTIFLMGSGITLKNLSLSGEIASNFQHAIRLPGANNVYLNKIRISDDPVLSRQGGGYSEGYTHHLKLHGGVIPGERAFPLSGVVITDCSSVHDWAWTWRIHASDQINEQEQKDVYIARGHISYLDKYNGHNCIQICASNVTVRDCFFEGSPRGNDIPIVFHTMENSNTSGHAATNVDIFNNTFICNGSSTTLGTRFILFEENDNPPNTFHLPFSNIRVFNNICVTKGITDSGNPLCLFAWTTSAFSPTSLTDFNNIVWYPDTTGTTSYAYNGVNSLTSSLEQWKSADFSKHGVNSFTGINPIFINPIYGTYNSFIEGDFRLSATSPFLSSAARVGLLDFNKRLRLSPASSVSGEPGALAREDLWLPTNPTITNIQENQFTINWTDNAGNESGYKVYTSTDDISYSFAGSTLNNSITLTNLQNNTLYYVKVYPFLYPYTSNSYITNNATTKMPFTMALPYSILIKFTRPNATVILRQR